jgi:hypothetical protein
VTDSRDTHIKKVKKKGEKTIRFSIFVVVSGRSTSSSKRGCLALKKKVLLE